MSSFVASRQSPLPADWTKPRGSSEDSRMTDGQAKAPHYDSARTIPNKLHALYPSQASSSTTSFASAPSNLREGVQTQQQASRQYTDTLQPNHAAPELTSPTFSFDDYLTPEFSSENFDSEQPTPNNDSTWHDTQADPPHITDHSTQLTFPDPCEDFDLSVSLNPLDQSYSGKTFAPVDNLRFGDRLLTPDPTSGSGTPEQQVSSHRPISNSIQVPSYQNMSGSSQRATREPASELSPGFRYPRSPSDRGHAQNDHAVLTHAVSPAVLVSTYSRGDSPARPETSMSRSLSKRSRSSRLGEHSEAQRPEPVVQPNAMSQSSRLQPPTGFEQPQWEEGDVIQRSGLAPDSRDSGLVMSLKDLDEERERAESRAGVEQWLANSEAGSPTEVDLLAVHNRVRKDRVRTRSTGARFDAMGQVFSDSHIPGPGKMLDEVSDYYYSDGDSVGEEVEGETSDLPETPPAQISSIDTADDSYFPPVEDEVAPDQLEPLPQQFFRRQPWQDPMHYSKVLESRSQPATANQAIYTYDKQAAKFETASRAATWGTRRRLSDSEIASIIDGSQVSRHLSLKDTLANRARARGSSIINSVKNSIPGRSNSFIKRKLNQQSSRQHSPEESIEHPPPSEAEHHRNSVSSLHPLQRMSSSAKSKPPKSPPISSTSGAFMAMTKQLTAVGGSSATSPEHEQNSNSLLGALHLKRPRSRSDMTKTPKSTFGLPTLFTQHSEPSAPVLASPLQLPETTPHTFMDSNNNDMDDDIDDDEPGIKMEMPMQSLNIIPTLEGFRTHVRQLNPRLEPFLIDRIANDQLRRYKKLVKARADHTRAVQIKRQCSSGKHCFDLGGKTTLLPPRTNSKDANSNYAQFKVAPSGESDGEDGNFVEGIVTPALFPAGVPPPPTSHLPAEFECPLCFQVKRFQKPSDWTKHVHEDVQPFSCTFPNCSEPKAFKRKADWVRHENERHRHLEWWKCNIQECHHVCYRKDNFVQHLVREHKMTEPKPKAQKGNGTRARAATRPGQTDEFWRLVDDSRHETTNKPKDEVCKFCKNPCSSWKKLSVHVGKHMEQIAMPILELVEKRIITAETVVSPIDPPPPQNASVPAPDTTNLNVHAQYPPSPYAATVHSAYPGSSAGHSPAAMHSSPHVITSDVNPVAYQHNPMPGGMHPLTVNNDHNSGGHLLAPTYGYESYDNFRGTNYVEPPHNVPYSQGQMVPGHAAPYHQQTVARPQPIESGYNPMAVGPMYGPPPYYQGDHQNDGANRFMTGYGQEMSHDEQMNAGGHSGPPSHGHTPIATRPGGDDATFYGPPQPQGGTGPQYY